MIKKLLLTIVSFSLLHVYAYSQSTLEGYYYNSSDIGINFTNEIAEINDSLQLPELLSPGAFSYTQNEISKITFVKFKDKNQHDFLMLHNCPILLLFESESNKPVEFWGNFTRVFYPEGFEYSTSSVYQQGKEIYPAENLKCRELSKPWVEGAEDSGIGEWIKIQGKTTKYGRSPNISGLLISNGYVSYNKPHLYEFNNRVKKITITDHEGNQPFTVELLDTPNPLNINLPEEYENIKITIDDVYPGLKWDDTCINFIIPYGF